MKQNKMSAQCKANPKTQSTLAECLPVLQTLKRSTQHGTLELNYKKLEPWTPFTKKIHGHDRREVAH